MTFIFENDKEKKVEQKLEEMIKKCRTFEGEVNQLKNVVAAQGILQNALMMVFENNNVFKLEDFQTAVKVIKDNLVEKQNG